MTAEAKTSSSEAFHELIHQNHMYGLWELASQMTPHPMPKTIPHMWHGRYSSRFWRARAKWCRSAMSGGRCSSSTRASMVAGRRQIA